MRGLETKTSPTGTPASHNTSKAYGRASPSASADDGGVGPDEPDEDEFELIGDDDLGPADLGPADPNARDPDAGSGRIRKIARESGRDTGSGLTTR